MRFQTREAASLGSSQWSFSVHPRKEPVKASHSFFFYHIQLKFYKISSWSWCFLASAVLFGLRQDTSDKSLPQFNQVVGDILGDLQEEGSARRSSRSQRAHTQPINERTPPKSFILEPVPLPLRPKAWDIAPPSLSMQGTCSLSFVFIRNVSFVISAVPPHRARIILLAFLELGWIYIKVDEISLLASLASSLERGYNLLCSLKPSNFGQWHPLPL